MNWQRPSIRNSRSAAAGGRWPGRLRLAGLVRARRDRRRMLYRITSDHLAALIDEVLQYSDHIVENASHYQRR